MKSPHTIIHEENTEKFKTPSKSLIPALSRQNLLVAPDEEELLNIIRIQQPKAEIKSTFVDSQVHSRTKSLQFEEFEDPLKAQRVKYRRLEAQYNELLNRNTHIEKKYKERIQNLQEELEKIPENKERAGKLKGIVEEVKGIKVKLKEALGKTKTVSKRIKELESV